jgi:ribosomal protein S18 acetylase RimI-like enzyme
MVIKRVTEKAELSGIKDLQTANLKSGLDKEEIEKEGFVTAEYSPELLARMNTTEPHIIAKDGDQVVGYALVATRSVIGGHPLLDDFFRQADTLIYKGTALCDVNYVVVGQLCVAKAYRGMGVVKKMYDLFKDELAHTYPYCMTDVDEMNPRSLKAHLSSGFEVISTLEYGGSKWYIVIRDWNA